MSKTLDQLKVGDGKQCSTCGTIKPLSEYYICVRNKDGYHRVCKECKAKYNREYRLANKGKIKALMATHYRNNREKKEYITPSIMKPTGKSCAQKM